MQAWQPLQRLFENHYVQFECFYLILTWPAGAVLWRCDGEHSSRPSLSFTSSFRKGESEGGIWRSRELIGQSHNSRPINSSLVPPSLEDQRSKYLDEWALTYRHKQASCQCFSSTIHRNVVLISFLLQTHRELSVLWMTPPVYTLSAHPLCLIFSDIIKGNLCIL